MQGIRSTNLKTRVLIPLSVAFSVVFYAFLTTIYLQGKNNLEERLTDDLRAASDYYTAEMEWDMALLHATLATLSRDRTIQDAFIDRRRDNLDALTRPLFDRLKSEHQVTHLNFSDPDRIVFLRVHRPDLYGDVISRETTLNAVRTGEVSSGIDIGRYRGLLTIHVVQPWIRDGRLIGYLEMGKEINPITRGLKGTLGVDAFVILAKQNLAKEQWEEGMIAFGRIPRWDRYPAHVIIDRTMAQIPPGLEERIQRGEIGATLEPFQTTLEGTRFGVGFIPIVDAAGKTLGSFAILRQTTSETARAYSLIVRMACLSLVIGAALFIFFHQLLQRVEKDIDSTELKLRLQGAALESAANAIAIADREGRIIWYNPAFLELTGQSMEETIGGQLLVPPSEHHPSGFFRSLLDTVRSGVVWHGELINTRKDGLAYVEETTIAPVKDRNGEITHFIAVKQDVTHRKKTEMEMRRARDVAVEASQIKSEFLANMSHEIRTPLNGIVGMTDLVLETKLTAEQQDHLHTVRLSADALLTVINDILDFSKIEAGKLELDPVPFELRRFLGDLMKSVAFRAEEKRIELVYRVAPDLPEHLIGDPARLRQIIINLVVNAIKFTEKGEVVVDVRFAEDGPEEIALQFSVTDTGIGIAPEKQKKIFDSFTQADGSTSRKYGGTGLGLAIASHLVRMMDGEIRLESEEGRGSVFRFDCRLKRKSPADETGIYGEPLPAKIRNRAVLIVDDNKTNGSVLCDLLSRWGLDPSSLQSGDDALAFLSEVSGRGEPVPLLLIDTAMPGMDGFDLAWRIRDKYGRAPEIVLMHPVERRKGDSRRARDLGVRASLTKPVRESELRRAVLAAFGFEPEPGRVETNEEPGRTNYHRPLRILLAEDHPVNQKLMVRLLEKRGHQVEVAENGRMAVQLYERREEFDLILMDLQMPEMGGIEATGAIREREAGSGVRIPIIALTAHALKGDKERCRAAGMDGYVSKPIRIETLFQVIGDVLGESVLEENGTGKADFPPHGAPVTEVLDLESALRMVDGSMEVFQEIVDIFIDCMPQILLNLEAAVEKKDTEGLERAAHSFRGSVGSLCANDAIEAAGLVEDLAREGDLGGAIEAYQALQNEVERLKPVLAGLSGSAG